MAELKQYDAVVNGHTTTLRLTEKAAKARGLTETKAGPAPANKGGRGRTRGRTKPTGSTPPAGEQGTPPAGEQGAPPAGDASEHGAPPAGEQGAPAGDQGEQK